MIFNGRLSVARFLNREVIFTASSREYLDFILERLSEADGITFRPMMGEFIIYLNGKIIGGIYDDRFLLKPVDTLKSVIKTVSYEIPYKGGKAMLLADDVDDSEYLCKLIYSVYEGL